MSDPRQQKRLLAVLLLVLLGFATYRVMQMTGGGPGGGGRSGEANQAERVLAELEVPRLNLNLLKREAATYTPGRDPFRFGAAPKPPRRVAPKPARKRQQPKPKPERPPQVAPVPAQPPAPIPPQVDFTYLGSFGPNTRRIAVFTRDGEIFNALTGDVLLESFIVDKIGFESADITFVGFPDTPGKRLEAGG